MADFIKVIRPCWSQAKWDQFPFSYRRIWKDHRPAWAARIH